MNSYTEENYLKAIYQFSEKVHSPISTNDIAGRLHTSAASVTDMLKKLSRKKLIHYKKYNGVTLTPRGKKAALGVIRKHRLWEMFLVRALRFKWDEVHEVAEQLEHIRSEKLIKQVERILNFPKFDPHGDPIPDRHGKFKAKKSLLLSELKENSTCLMTGVVDHSDEFLRYLAMIGIALGSNIRIRNINEYDKSLSIVVKKKKLFISGDVAKNILVRKK